MNNSIDSSVPSNITPARTQLTSSAPVEQTIGKGRITRATSLKLGEFKQALREEHATPVEKHHLETSPQNKELNKSKRASVKIIRSVSHKFAGKISPSSSGVATPQDIENTAKKSLDLVVIGGKKDRSFMDLLKGRARVKGGHSYDLGDAKAVSLLGPGSTLVAFSVTSQEDPGQKIAMKVPRDISELSPEERQTQMREVERDTAITKVLNEGEKRPGVVEDPYGVQVLSKEAQNMLFEKQTTRQTGLAEKAVLTKLYSGDLKSKFSEFTLEDRVKTTVHLFQGYDRLEKKKVLNLDSKPENVLVKLDSNGQLEEAVLSDFGNAYQEEELEKDPNNLMEMTWSAGYSSNVDITNFNRARFAAIEADNKALQKQHVKEAVGHAKKAMAFNFGMILLETFTGGTQAPPFIAIKPPDYQPDEKEKYLENGVQKTTPEGNQVIAALTVGGSIRTEAEEGDIEKPHFNREAFPEVPKEVISVVEGLLDPDPSTRLTVAAAKSQFMQYAKTVPYQ